SDDCDDDRTQIYKVVQRTIDGTDDVTLLLTAEKAMHDNGNSADAAVSAIATLIGFPLTGQSGNHKFDNPDRPIFGSIIKGRLQGLRTLARSIGCSNFY